MYVDADHEEFRASVRSLAERHVRPFADAIEADGKFPADLIQVFREAGLVQLAVPEEYGGPGGDLTSICIAREEVGRAGSATLSTLAGQNNVMTLALLSHGTEEQRARFMPRLAEGAISLLALTEPGAGSDPREMTTRAVADGDEWVINGAKSMIGWGKLADYALIVARNSPPGADPAISCFITETTAPGFIEDRHNQKMGQYGLPNVDLRFEELRVPRDNLLGPVGGGMQAALKGLHLNRLTMSAVALGVAQQALAYARTYLADRIQNGRPLSDHQGLRWMIADAATEIEAARALMYACAALADSGVRDGRFITMSSMVKYKATEVAVAVASAAIQLMGGAGYMTEHPVERYLRDIRVTTIYEGTSEIQKNTIARGLIDLGVDLSR